MRKVLSGAARYRAVETTVVGVLTAMVCAVALLVPLLQRAIVQSVLNTVVAESSARDTGIVVTSIPPANGTYPTADPATLADQVPEGSRPLFGPGVGSVAVDVGLAPPRKSSPTGKLMWRSDACQHVRFTSGRCPTGQNQVAVSDAESQRRGWRVGSRVAVFELMGGLRATVTVTGVYVQVPARYWFGTPLSSGAGESTAPVFDTMLTSQATVLIGGADATGQVTPWVAASSELDLPIRTGEIRPGELIARGSDLGALAGEHNPLAYTGRVPQVTASTGLTDIAHDVDIQQRQMRTAVPLLLAQLIAVLLAVLWLVLVALTEQRRPELALARLRGRSPRNARRVLLAETVPTIIAGAGGGLLLALAVSYVARHCWLAGSPGFSAAWTDPAYLLAAALACLTLAVLSVVRPSRQPIAALFRSVPARSSRLVLGTVEGAVVAVGLVAYLALLTGQVTGPVAAVVPATLAAALGVVGARLVPVVLSAVARRSLARGRVAAAVGSTEAARRPTARWLVPVTALATASVVFGATAAAVGERNQVIAGHVDNGAPVVAVTDATSARTLREAVAEARDHGVDATPVVQLRGSAAGSPTTVAVVPQEFRRIASLVPADRAEGLWSRIVGAGTRPVSVTGRSLTGEVRVEGAGSAPAGATYEVDVRMLSADGSRNDVQLAILPLRDGSTAAVSTYLPCGDGCHVIAIVVDASGTGKGTEATIRFSDLRLDGTTYALGTTQAWHAQVADPARAQVTVGPGTLTLAVADAGLPTLEIDSTASAGDPVALATPYASAGSSTTLDGTGLDGFAQPMQQAGTVSVVPGAPAASVVTSLDDLLAVNSRIDANGRALVFLGRDDATQLAGLRGALRARGVGITEVDRASEVTRTYARSAAAWALKLAEWAALAALVVALLGLVVLVANSWRSRSRDFAGLRMAGLTDREIRAAALRELVPLAVVGVVVGAVAGVVGGLSAVATLPLFTHPPKAVVVDLGPAWGASALAAVLALVIIVSGAVVMALWTVRRSTLERLRDPG